MKRLILFALALTIAALTRLPAHAGTEALISFHGADNGSWERRLAVQDLLRDGYGFDNVSVVTDATAGEIPARVRSFLETPGEAGDRRLIWVSGLDAGSGGNICPDPNADPIRPSVPSLIFAPACYSAAVRFPQGARHYGLTAPKINAVAARLGRVDATDPAMIGLITLPADDSRHVDGADAIVFDHIKARRTSRIIDPTALLASLRGGFRWNGSAYTPSLDLYHRGAEKDAVGPFGFDPMADRASKLARVRPAERLAGGLKLHTTPLARTSEALTVTRRAPVRILRADRSGAMRYVAVGDNLFGWVRNHDLGL